MVHESHIGFKHWFTFGRAHKRNCGSGHNSSFRPHPQCRHSKDFRQRKSAAAVYVCRDAWFEVPLPFFLRNAEVGLNWSRPLTGTFLGVFIIVYGQIQSWCPQLVLEPLRQAPANKYVAMLWAAILLFVPLGLGPTILTSAPFLEHDIGAMSGILIVRSPSSHFWSSQYTSMRFTEILRPHGEQFILITRLVSTVF
jgi:hypothetical protein